MAARPRAASTAVAPAVSAPAEARTAAARTTASPTGDAPREPPSYSITELAQEFDITPRAIRFYEDMGLLTPHRTGRMRVYTARERTRLKLTLRGKRLGLSLSEIKQLVDMYDSRTGASQQLQAFLQVLAEHRRQLEQQREDIEVTLAEIGQHEARCRSLLSEAARRRPRSRARDPA